MSAASSLWKNYYKRGKKARMKETAGIRPERAYSIFPSPIRSYSRASVIVTSTNSPGCASVSDR
jgi:hypothetical protein